MPTVGPPANEAELNAPFRPRRGRRMATWIGIGQSVLFAGIALLMPDLEEGGLGLFDRVGILAVGASIGIMLWRFARLAAFVTESGLTVRNLAGDRRVEWAEIVNVRFGGGQPWVSLDLVDFEPMAVMAIQRADGAFGEAEARRLATLVALHSPTEHDD